MNLDTRLILPAKIYWKSIKNLNVKCTILKLLGKNVKNIILNFGKENNSNNYIYCKPENIS